MSSLFKEMFIDLPLYEVTHIGTINQYCGG